MEVPSFFIYIILIGLKLTALCSPGFSALTNIKSVKISGTFIQYQSWMMQLNQEKWITELDALKKIKMDTIVIQWIKSDMNRFYPVNFRGTDPTETILKYADKNNIQVILGVQFEKDWWTRWDDGDFLEQITHKTLLFGKKVFDRYKKHPSFIGWYIPYEMSDTDFETEEIESLNKFLRNISHGLKKMSRKNLVAFSTFFEGRIPAQAVERIYSKIFKKSGVDILMVQDGVGVHNWTTQMQDHVAPYLTAYHKAAKKNGLQTWSVVESFAAVPDALGGNSGRIPAQITRLQEQLQIQASHPTDKVMTFDFFHYMSPHRGVLQKALYDAYLSQLETQPETQPETKPETQLKK